MGTDCPICEATPSASATHCPKCGFPTALYATLHGPVDLGPTPTPDEDGGNLPSPPGAAKPAPSAEAAVNATIVRGLEERVALLSTIDRDAPDVTGELCEAALNEASGRVADAQQVLRSAQGRLDREAEELLARHVTDLEARGRTLQETGLHLALEDPIARIAESAAAGDVESAVPALAAAERRVGLIEAHWRGLQALVAQVMTLRAEAEALGIAVSDSVQTLEAARASLATMPATEHDLDVTAQAAASALMALHEAVPPALEAELARHREALDAHPKGSRAGTPARKLHAEASQHLKEGRLDSAILSLRALREELARLEREPPPPPPAPERAPPPTVETAPAPVPPPVVVAPPESAAPPPAAVGPPTVVAAPSVPAAPPGGARSPAESPAPASPPPARIGAEAIGELLRKARSLAARVRSLPPDSAQAASAARAIQEATDLLKARRFEEADAALTRLMRTLAATPARS